MRALGRHRGAGLICLPCKESTEGTVATIVTGSVERIAESVGVRTGDVDPRMRFDQDESRMKAATCSVGLIALRAILRDAKVMIATDTVLELAGSVGDQNRCYWSKNAVD